MIPAKVAIIEKIGESGVLLPELINRGLAASDRLKYFLQLLQAAYTHALAPTEPLPNLRIQREASGLDDVQLDRVIEGSVDRGSGTVYVPGSCTIVATMFEESRRMLQETRMGASRADALRALDERTQVDDLRTFIMAMLQADAFGVSISRMLRAQADEIRIRRRQVAQELSQKAPIKMLFPLAVCIFPAVFVVVLLPAVIRIFRTF